MDMHNTDVQPQELTRAQQGWANFVKASQIVCTVTVAVLVLMAIFLL